MRDIIEKKYSRLDIEDINRMALENPVELARNSEEYYNSQVMAAAKQIAQGSSNYKFVLLCGPSASGKTTTAHKLKHRLVDQGVGARVISMDNFFMGMKHYPKLEDGSPDMESVEALDMDLLNSCFEALIKNGRAMFPVFDFAEQKQTINAHEFELNEKDILIMEGIHALNPMVLKDIPSENIFRIYVSVRTKFINGEEEVLVPKDIRLIRRMVRDNKFRNYPPLHTLRYWVHVVKSEKINIDPYRDDVDLKMDNTMDYEVCVWHELLESLLSSINLHDYDDYPELQRIFAGLTRFVTLDYNLIPENSLLREFIGEEI